jgi:cytochrome P450
VTVSVQPPITSGSRTFPPGPRPHWYWGNGREFGRDNLAFLMRCARDYGDMVRVQLHNRSIFLLNHPALVAEVLVKQHRNFKKDFRADVRRWALGNSVLISAGEDWLRQRRFVQQAFRQDRLARYCELMTGHMEEVLTSWQAGQRRDLFDEFRRLALEGVVKCLFQQELGERTRAFVAALEVLLGGYRTWFNRFLKLPFRLSKRRRSRRALEHIDEVVFSLIRENRAGGADRGDLLSALLADDGEQQSRPLVDREARDQVVTLMAAGSETTAVLLAWTWILLAQHPAAESRLVAEVREVLGDRMPAAADVPKLGYTHMVLLESLRLYPPVSLLGREALSPCAIGGYAVPAGQTIWMIPWVLHRDARWFDRAEQFDPERWRDGLEERLPGCAFLPFGAGPRICVGRNLALMEAALALAMIAQRFRFSALCGPVRPQLSPMLRPSPVAHTVLAARGGLKP